MVNSSNKDENLSKCNVDASAEATIKFLRARLLSERSISRTARQRADELAKRVLELEKQLKFVTLQRKQAERATAYVLAILENHGMSDWSESMDSGSDREAIMCDSMAMSNSKGGEMTSIETKPRKYDIMTFIGNELGSSLMDRDLSWRNGKSSVYSIERQKQMDLIKRSDLERSDLEPPPSSLDSIGKSCCQIEEIETRDGAGNHSVDLLDGYDFCTQTLEEESEAIYEKNLLEDPASGISLNEREDSCHHFGRNDAEKDMARALERQAQLIEQYEAEEKAQGEWEERFVEYNGGIPDLSDPGNHSDVTEEIDEVKAPAPLYSPEAVESQKHDLNSVEGDLCISKGSIAPLCRHLDVKSTWLDDENLSNIVKPDSETSEFTFFVGDKMHNQQTSEGHQFLHSSTSYCRKDFHNVPGKNSETNSSSCMACDSTKVEASETRNELTLIPHQTSNKIECVLQTLQQAKQSLIHKLDISSVDGGSVGNGIACIPTTRNENKLETPVGYGGLSRLPSDLQFKSSSHPRIIGLDSHIYSRWLPRANVGQNIFSIPYIESSRSIASIDNRLRLPAGLPPSCRYSYANSSSSTVLHTGENTYPTYPLFHDSSAQLSSIGRFPTHLPNAEGWPPPTTPSSFYDNYINPNIHR